MVRSSKNVSVATVNEIEQSAQFRQATQSGHDRLMIFLKNCNQQGHRYRPRSSDWLPTLKQLSKYCGCSEAAMNRIASGRVTRINFDVLETLQVIACIALPPFADSSVQMDTTKEMKARLADADRWLGQDDRSRGFVMEAIIYGIR